MFFTLPQSFDSNLFDQKGIFFEKTQNDTSQHTTPDGRLPSVFISCIHLIIFGIGTDFLISVLPFLNREKVFGVSRAKLKRRAQTRSPEKRSYCFGTRPPPDAPEQTLCSLYSHANTKISEQIRAFQRPKQYI